MFKCINYAPQIKCGVTITAEDINVNEHWTQKEKKSEVEVVILDHNRKRYILKYITPIIYGRPLYIDLGTLEYTTSE